MTCQVTCGSESNYSIPNFNGTTVEVWEWKSNFKSHFIMEICMTFQRSLSISIVKPKSCWLPSKSNGGFFITCCFIRIRIPVIKIGYLEKSLYIERVTRPSSGMVSYSPIYWLATKKHSVSLLQT